MPSFKADDALLTLKRMLRDLRLTQRGDGFDWKAQRILEWTLQGDVIEVRLTNRPLASPQFDQMKISSSSQIRQLGEELQRRLARWSDE